MANRIIKDAKDTKSNELIYFRGHAKATYMSDGRTVEDAINSAGTGGGADMTNYYTKAQVDAKGYLTSIPSEYITESELNTVLGNLKFITITQTAYDNLPTKDPNTIYIISE
jgi:hypothetical protein